MNASVIQLDEIPPVRCPCGKARRVLLETMGIPLSIHLTDIDQTAQPHFHHRTHEVYVVLECSDEAYLEIDGSQVPLKPLTMVVIPPHRVHRLVGQAKILLIAHPQFSVDDECLVGH